MSTDNFALQLGEVQHSSMTQSSVGYVMFSHVGWLASSLSQKSQRQVTKWNARTLQNVT